MNTVTSKDGTVIAYEQTGQGIPLILVGGMFEQRAMESETSQLAQFPLLSQSFTVIHYDRRGRGASGDTLPFAVEREIEDIEALINALGGSAYLFGISSGAALALEASLNLGNEVKKLAIYDAPYNDEAEARQTWMQFRKDLDALLAENRHGDAVACILSVMGVPEEHLAGMRDYPMWALWEGIAPTIAYDAAALGTDASVPTERLTNLTVPTLVINGGESFPFMQVSALTLTKHIPNVQHRVLEGQGHEVTAEAIAPVLVEYFRA